MTCCGAAFTRRQWIRNTAWSSAGVMLAGCAATRGEVPASSAEPSAAAIALLRDNVSIDVHSHGGPDGVGSRSARPSSALAASMRAGGIAILCLADVPDAPILGRNVNGVLVALRTPEPGFLYRYH